MNDTRLCPDYLQKYFAEQYDPASWLTRAEYVNLIINTLSTVPAIFLNLLVIAATLRSDTLRSPSFLLICSMAVSDFLVGVLLQPRFTVLRVAEITVDLDLYCRAAQLHFVINVFMLASLLTAMLISVDRYLALHKGKRYTAIVTRGRTIRALVMAWIISICFGAIVPVVSIFLSVVFLACFGFILVVVIIFCYIMCCYTLRQHRYRLKAIHKSKAYVFSSNNTRSNSNKKHRGRSDCSKEAVSVVHRQVKKNILENQPNQGRNVIESQQSLSKKTNYFIAPTNSNQTMLPKHADLRDQLLYCRNQQSLVNVSIHDNHLNPSSYDNHSCLANQSSLSDNQSSHGGNHSSLVGNQSSHGGNHSSLDDNQSSIGGSQSSLGGNQSSLGNDQSSLGGNQSSLGGNQSSHGNDQSSLGGNQSSLGGNQSSIGGNQSSHGNDQSSLGGNQSSIGGNQSSHGNDQSSLGGNQSSIDGNQSSHGNDQSSLGGNQTSLGGNQSSLGDNQSSLGNDQSSLGGNQISLGDNQSSLGDNQSILGGNQSTLGGNQSSLGGNQSSLGNDQSSLGGNQSSLCSNQSSLGDNQTGEDQTKSCHHSSKHGLASDESVSSDTSSDDVKLDLSNMADLGNGTSLASVRYRPEETLSLTNSFSEVNLVKYKKIYRTMYLIIALLFAFYAVLVVVTPAVYFVSGYNTCTKLVSDLGVAMIHLNSALNPIIYLVRMREVRAACLTLIKQLKDLRFLPI
ncbi:uncharacterized protein LOC5510454 isoform X1 [Nematostella vectensis]|uniref:uncharacterized protein LOC5510454 isoform X1 n=1 Tax=Nematostella vectensis TaxID=45351 RepID=UPI002076F5D0|nr:uncharacterized protein LOC5510454 isoform X1 [Nematostella vectensis]XP_032235497.2 uncharacterized protein LOC5510454 isoform X1 [Nematostella vectensis]